MNARLKAGLPTAVPSVVPPRNSPEFLICDTDRALLSAIAAGDHTAFDTLYERFVPTVHRIVQSVVRDTHQAEEVTQEVFLTIWRQAAQFDPS